ncbi:NUDIX domain-containing protein [Candidatus Uhrbacteria bacterium]|nr:NUDIX domain-containing protein [Candidatus Uhrbacteria bacterium]
MNIHRVLTQAHVAVGALLEKDGKVLLVHEYVPDHPDHEKWHIPCGWVDLGEDPLPAVIREVKEESGYDFTPTRILGVYSMVRKELEGAFEHVGGYRQKEGYPHGFKIIYVGEVDGEQGSFWEHEISETRWFTPEEIEAMDDATLRDRDVKQMVKDYFAGKRFPLDVITHTVREN